jgi:nucleoside-diphosphate kinase
MEEATGCFSASYVDPSGYERLLTLSFFAADRSVSLFDTKLQRPFLKRTQPPENIEMNNLYLGATVTICSRPMKIVDFADDKTRRLFATTRGATLLLVKPDAYQQMGQILDVVYHSGISVGRVRMVRMGEDEARHFAALAASTSGASATAAAGGGVSALTRDNMLAIELAGDDVVARVHELAGPADPADARSAAPRSLRALFGESRERNAVHVSASMEAAARELAHVFGREYPFTAVFAHCSAVVIKPHLVEAKQAGRVVDALLKAGLEVSAARSVIMGFNDAADFLEPYKTVVPEYSRWVKELTSGPCILLEMRGEECVRRVRELCGPYDPVLAQTLRPGTLRATFGIDTERNAVFCTDIERDGPLESKFLFKLLGE